MLAAGDPGGKDETNLLLLLCKYFNEYNISYILTKY